MRVRGGGRAGQKIVIAPPKTLDDTLAGEGVLSRTRPHFPCWGMCYLCTLACHLSSEFQDFQTAEPSRLLILSTESRSQLDIGPLSEGHWAQLLEHPVAKLLPSPPGYLHLGSQDRTAIFLYKRAGCPKIPSCIMYPGHTRPPTFSWTPLQQSLAFLGYLHPGQEQLLYP